MLKLFRTDKTAHFELVAVSLTVILKFILMDWLSMRAFYIGGICLFWALYFLQVLPQSGHTETMGF